MLVVFFFLMRKLKLRGSNNLPKSPIDSDPGLWTGASASCSPSVPKTCQSPAPNELSGGAWPRGCVRIKWAHPCKRVSNSTFFLFILLVIIYLTRRMLFITREWHSGRWPATQRCGYQNHLLSCIIIPVIGIQVIYSFFRLSRFNQQFESKALELELFALKILRFCSESLYREKETRLKQGGLMSWSHKL